MNFNNLLYVVEAQICTITINRPDKLNALSHETINELKTAVQQALDSKEVKAILLTGSGQKAFVAGADIAEFTSLSQDGARELAERGHAALNLIEHSPKPALAAINGFALGGGCELAMVCHMRIASKNAKFAQPEINLGLIPGYGGTQRLIRLIGRTKATEMLLTGNMISAEEAKALGLLNDVVEQEELISTAKKVLQNIVNKSPLVVAQILKLTNLYNEYELPGFQEEVKQFGKCFTTEDFKEGVGAFLEKRKANFTGK